MAEKRSLTSGETDLVRSVFHDAIDCTPVRLVLGKWWPLQPRSIVMAPMGYIHFHPDGDSWSDDFASEPLGLQGLFIHEMTHVWQAQTMGRFYLPLMRHPFCRYAYALQEGKSFRQYGIEQQAEIVRHVFLRRAEAFAPHTPPETLLPFSPA